MKADSRGEDKPRKHQAGGESMPKDSKAEGTKTKLHIYDDMPTWM